MKYHFKIHKEKGGFWAECLELVGCSTQADTKDELFILGTDTETSINEIYSNVCRILNRDIDPKREKKAAGDIRRMRYSYKKANKYFGFKPKYLLEEGIRNYVNWANSV